jgi:hypothetical protein
MSHGSTVPGDDSRPSPVAALVAKWRDEADGVTAMGYSQQGDRMRDCADELEAITPADHLLEGLLKDAAWRQQWHSRLGRGETETEGKFYARMEGLIADRDEWREQHERLLAMYRASEAKLYGASVAGPADAGKEETQKMSDCNGNTGPKSFDEGTPIDPANIAPPSAEPAGPAVCTCEMCRTSRMSANEQQSWADLQASGGLPEVAGPADAGSHETITLLREFVEREAGLRAMAGKGGQHVGRSPSISPSVLKELQRILAASASAPTAPRETPDTLDQFDSETTAKETK